MSNYIPLRKAVEMTGWSVIAESAQTSKKMTSQDKLPICEANFQIPKSSKISDQDSTIKEKVFKPYWNDSCAEISSHLSWLTEIDWQDSASNSSNTWLNKTVEKSWFSTKLRKVQNKNLFQTSALSSMYFPVGSMDSENIVSVSRKIKISPTKEQSQIFKSWLGCYRYVYNKALEAIQKEAKTPSWFNIKTEMIKGLPEWANKIPYQIKPMAIKEAITNLKQQKKMAKLKKKSFNIRYKSRKAPQQSCYIPKSAVKTSGIYPSISGNLHYHEELPKLIQDSRLIYTNNKFYICVPTTKERSLSDNQGRVVAIDPGIRKFITFVSHDSAGKLGENDIGRIYRLCFWLDNLYSRTSKVKAKQRRRMQQAASRVRAKVRDLIDELHHKAARFLVDNFDVILLPTFETSEMVIKKGRKIRSKTARAMLTVSFYRFKQFLKNKALECGKVVLDCCEAYTSKTNNFTGVIDNKLGGRTYIKVGDHRIDRDINGALGILLKALVDTPSLRVCLDSQRANVNIS